jgi:DNA (cytosine-5)-methyltransferase 1
VKQLRMVSLFTGAGGMDYGFEAAGFTTSVALEFDHDCCETFRTNRPTAAVIEKDIHETHSSEILDTAGLQVGEVDLLIGGPPCQPFSKAGYWVNGDTKRLDDERAGTLHAYMRCVADLLPQVCVLENVHGISYSGKEEGFQLLTRLTDEINRKYGSNYQLSWRVINAAEYGVPQIRQRFFMVAHRDGKVFRFPNPTHSLAEPSSGLDGAALQPGIKAWDAIGDLQDKNFEGEDLRVKGRWGDLLPSIPEGENYLWHTNRKSGLPLFGWRTRYWSFLLKLAKDKPSWTIQAQPGPNIGPFHWKSRLLSVREMGRIQTFPDDVQFVGSRTSVQKQIGNAVPSLLAEVIGRAIITQFFGMEVPDTPTLAVTPKRPIPPAEPLTEVAEKYLHLVGDHADHPGTKKKSNQLQNKGANVQLTFFEDGERVAY